MPPANDNVKGHEREIPKTREQIFFSLPKRIGGKNRTRFRRLENPSPVSDVFVLISWKKRIKSSPSDPSSGAKIGGRPSAGADDCGDQLPRPLSLHERLD